MIDVRERQQTYNSFGEGLSRAFEMAATPAVFAAIGFGLDAWLGVRPLFTIALFVLAIVGMGIRTWYVYDAEMKVEEQRLLGRRSPSGGGRP